MKEAAFQSALARALNRPRRDTRVHRQNAGKWLALPMAVRALEDIARKLAAAWLSGGLPAFVAALHGIGHHIEGAPAGAADLSGIIYPEGWRIEVECKGEDTRVRRKQDAWCTFIEAWGGVYARVRYDETVSLETNVLRGLDEVDRVIDARRKRSYDGT